MVVVVGRARELPVALVGGLPSVDTENWIAHASYK